MVSDPSHGGHHVGFVAAFGDDVEPVVGVDHAVEAATEAGVGVEDVAGFILDEAASAGAFDFGETLGAEVVAGGAIVDLLACEGDVVVVVEIGGVGRNPREIPTMRFLKASSLASGAREMATYATSRAPRCGNEPAT